jgi:hypothetical protein
MTHQGDAGERRALAPTATDWPNLIASGSPSEANPGFPDVPGAQHGGSTEHFDVYFDPVLGSRGRTLAASVLPRAERDLAIIRGYFGGTTLPREHLNVVLARLPENERAYHYGGGGTDLFCDVATIPALNPWYSSFLAASLMVEIVATARDQGWEGDRHTGEGLSRVIAAALYPHRLTGFATAAVWLNSERDDFVNEIVPSDRDPQAIGCATLFLNYLHHQLGYSWQEIVAAGGGTLAETHNRLTGDAADPFPGFATLLAVPFPPGRPAELTTDNPFPLAADVVSEPPESQFELVGPGISPAAAAGSALAVRPEDLNKAPAVASVASDVATEPMAPRPEVILADVLGNRRWMRSTTPFAHIRASNVFTPAYYEALVNRYQALWNGDRFARNIPGYDVDATGITAEHADAFSVFTSRAWHDMWAELFGVEATGDVNVTLHHHRVGSASGSPHNDLNPGWFVDDRGSDGINIHDPVVSDYRKGTAEGHRTPVQRIRAVVILYYLANEPYQPWHGGLTGLYRSYADPVERPTVAVPPVNNSLVAFECTPTSFHSFVTNPYVERNSLVMWLHQTEERAVSRWGPSSIVQW